MTRYVGLSQALRDAAPAPAQIESDEFDLLGVFRLIRRRIGLIVVMVILVLVLAIPAILAITPFYHAYSRVLIQDPLATTLSVGSDPRTDLDLATEMERLVSRDVSHSVVEALELDKRAEFNPVLREASAMDEVLSSLKSFIRNLVFAVFGARPDPAETEPEEETRTADPLDQVIRTYLGALSIGREAEGNVIVIGFTSQDPAVAAAVPNRLLKVYLDSRAAEMADQIRTAEDWFDARIAEQRERVQDVESKLERYLRTADPASNELRQANLDLIANLDAARTGLLRQRAELGQTLAALDGAGTAAEKLALVETSLAAGLRRDLRLQQRALNRLQTTLGERNAKVIEARERLALTDAEIEVEIAQYRDTLEASLASLVREGRGVSEGLESVQKALLRQEELLSRKTVLGQSFSAEQSVLHRLEEQRRTLLSRGDLPLADVEVLMPASLPSSPSSRGRTIYLLGALLAAAMLGLTAACVVELFDQSIRSPQQIRDLRGVGGAVLLPRAPRKLTRASVVKDLSRLDAAFGDALRGMILTLERTSNNELPESVLVTSSSPGEGKSVTAIALAGELASPSGPRVLLVDADLRRGRIHTMFDAPAGPGLAEILAGEAQLSNVVRRDAESGIAYVPVGTRRGGHLQNRDQLYAVLKAAKSHADIVIVDGPPALVTTDAAFLAQTCDRTLFVAQWGRTSRQTLEAGVDRLRLDPQNPILVAITRVRPSRQKLYGFNDAPASDGVLRRYLSEF